ncbi:lonely Cys domain-containing protein, partial [Streptomyces sp. NPDC051172]|uniref:lonely Cys domain-containing protein n=1 Tax=Streptomyces sp. NPDC051172 TaxID=3155796 RepID=UPI003430712D
LHLDPSEPVDERRRVELYTLVDEAMAERRDGSLAALGAFHLARHVGLLTERTLIVAPNGDVIGRSFTNKRAQSNVARTDMTGSRLPFAWEAEGGPDHLKTDLPGTTVRIPRDEVIELTTMDEELAKRAARAPLMLVVPNAGDGVPYMPRLISSTLKRPVLAHIGVPRLLFDVKAQRYVIRTVQGIPTGKMVLSEPDDLAPGGASATGENGFIVVYGGAQLPDRYVRSYTLTDPRTMRPVGRAVFTRADMAEREPHLRDPQNTQFFSRFDPVARQPVTAMEAPQWKGQDAYQLVMHGDPGYLGVVDARTEKKYAAVGDQIGEYLARRDSLTTHPPEHPIVARACRGNVASDDPPRRFRAGADAPFVANPLTNPSPLQRVSTRTGRVLIAMNQVHGLFQYPGQNDVYELLYTSVRGVRGTVQRLRPEPGEEVLSRLARVAGLHTGPDPVLPVELEHTMLLVRALREVFWHEIEDDRDDPTGNYQRLMRGIGALELMRRADGKLADGGAFTLDLLDHVLRAYLEQSGTPKPRPAAFADVAELRAAVRRVLDAAWDRLAKAKASDPVTVHDFVPQTEPMAHLDRAAQVIHGITPPIAGYLGLPEPLPASGPLRERVFWALAKAVQVWMSHPRWDVLVARILHLAGPVTPSDRWKALWLMTAAALRGHDVHDEVGLAAFDLAQEGMLSLPSAIVSSTGEHAGRNLTGRPLQGPLVTDGYLVSRDGTVANGQQRVGQWRKKDTYFLVVDGDQTHTEFGLPGGTTLRVPHEEIVALLRHDPALQSRELSVPLLVVGRRDSLAAFALKDALAAREGTARTTLTSAYPARVEHDSTANRYMIVLHADPVHAPPKDDWTRTYPPGLTHTHAPAAVVTHSMTKVPEAAASDTAAQHGTVVPAAQLPQHADQPSADPQSAEEPHVLSEGDWAAVPEGAGPRKEYLNAIGPEAEGTDISETLDHLLPMSAEQDPEEGDAQQASAVEQFAADGARSSVPHLMETGEGPMPNAAVHTDMAEIIPSLPVLLEKQRLFVADDRSHDHQMVFRDGLKPLGKGLEISIRAQEGEFEQVSDGFVGAARTAEEAVRQISSGYVWEIDAPGAIDVEATFHALGMTYRDTGRDKFLFAGGVHHDFVKSGRKVVEGKITSEEFTAGPSHQQPVEPVEPVEPVSREKHVFLPVEDVVSPNELQGLVAELGRDKEAGERYAHELGTRLEDHILATLSEQGKSAVGIDVHLSLENELHSLAGMALATVVASSFGSVKLQVGQGTYNICPRL